MPWSSAGQRSFIEAEKALKMSLVREGNIRLMPVLLKILYCKIVDLVYLHPSVCPWCCICTNWTSLQVAIIIYFAAVYSTPLVT